MALCFGSNLFSYNSAIAACSGATTRAEPERALSLLETMRERGVEPNLISYGSAIAACDKAGLWERAVSLLDEMKARNVKSDAVCYNSAVSACVKGKQLDRALSLVNEMRALGFEPTGKARLDAETDADFDPTRRMDAQRGKQLRYLRMMKTRADVERSLDELGALSNVKEYSMAISA